MNNVTLVGIIEEEFENVTTTFFQTLIIKAHDKLKNNLKWKYLWKHIHGKSFGATEEQLNLNNLKNKIETLLKFEARR